MRLELLPLLAREYNPQIINALSDLAATAGEDYEFLSMHARKQFEKSVIISKRKVKMDLKSINASASGNIAFDVPANGRKFDQGPCSA